MLKWLGGDKNDHPMHSVKAAEKILSELAPADAEQALDEVCGYLESVAKAPDFKFICRHWRKERHQPSNRQPRTFPKDRAN